RLPHDARDGGCAHGEHWTAHARILVQAPGAGLRYHLFAARFAGCRAMPDIPTAKLLALRDELRRRGQRRPMVFPSAAPAVVEAVSVAEEYGAVCEAMFLVMAVEKRMLNVQRELLRGALDVLSNGRVRTSHMEAMLDAASRRLVEDGLDRRCERV